jgi:hypothetical protein
MARSKLIFFALAALRSVPQAGSQFHGLATPIGELSGLATLPLRRLLITADNGIILC